MESKVVEMRCKAFGGEGVKANKLMIDADGTVSVYDRIAGHYTTCHRLAKSAMDRARKSAK